MQVEILKLASRPVKVTVDEGATVRDVFNAPGSGEVLGEGHEGKTLMKVAEEIHGSIDALGSIRVNGAPASLDTPVTPDSTVMIIPKVEGGC